MFHTIDTDIGAANEAATRRRAAVARIDSRENSDNILRDTQADRADLYAALDYAQDEIAMLRAALRRSGLRFK